MSKLCLSVNNLCVSVDGEEVMLEQSTVVDDPNSTMGRLEHCERIKLTTYQIPQFIESVLRAVAEIEGIDHIEFPCGDGTVPVGRSPSARPARH